MLRALTSAAMAIVLGAMTLDVGRAEGRVRLGIAVSDGPAAKVLARIAAKGYRRPAYVALWWRLGKQDAPTPSDLEKVRAIGAVPVIFASGLGVDTPRLKVFAEMARLYGGRIIFRWNHEPNGNLFPWSRWVPERYIENFRDVSRIIRAIAPEVEMAWAMVARAPRRAGELAQWWPGRDAVQVMALDFYSRREDPRFPPRNARLNGSIAAMRELSDSPILVTETGRLRGSGSRVRWLRSWQRVRGIEGAIYMDIAVDSPRVANEAHDWRIGGKLIDVVNEVNC